MADKFEVVSSGFLRDFRQRPSSLKLNLLSQEVRELREDNATKEKASAWFAKQWRVYGLMCQFQLQGRRPKRHGKTTVLKGRPHGILARVQRPFNEAQPRQLVVCGVTGIPLIHGDLACLAMLSDVHMWQVAG